MSDVFIYEDLSDPNKVSISVSVSFAEDVLSAEDLERELPGLYKELSTAAKDFWESQAGRSIQSSRRLQGYRQALQIESDDQSGSVIFDPDNVSDPNRRHAVGITEFGTSGFDLKPGFLRTTKKYQNLKNKKNLPYRIIPLHAIGPKDPSPPVEFRVVTTASSGWMYPYRKGLDLAGDVFRFWEQHSKAKIQEMLDRIYPTE